MSKLPIYNGDLGQWTTIRHESSGIYMTRDPDDGADRGPELINQISDLMLLAEAKGWANLDLPHESVEEDMAIIVRAVKDRGIKIDDFLITLRPSNGHWELMIFILENPEYGGKPNGKNKRETNEPK